MTDDECGALYPVVEQAKQALSVRQRADITVQARGYTTTYTITRALFEELTVTLWKKQIC